MCPPIAPARLFFTLLLPLLLLGLGATARAELPEPEALELRITPNERSASRGDVLDFLIEAVNTSAISLLREGETGGVALVLSLPEGLGFIPGSGRIELPSGQTVKALDPALSRTEPRLVQDRDGNPEPLNLAAGQGLRFRFQLRVLPQAAPYRKGTLAARLASADGTPLSNDSLATLRVEPDPELDLAQVLGDVFCDDNSNGTRDHDERGAGGVRIASDIGRVVDTDATGRFHLRDFRPGAHIVKLDTHTLGPSSKPTTHTSRLLDLTGGLIARVEFGVTCIAEVARPTELILAGQDAPNTPVPPSPVVMVRGDADALSLSWEGYTSPSRRATLLVEGEGMTAGARRERVRALNMPWRPGALIRPLKLFPAIEGEAISPENAHWQIDIHSIKGARRELIHVLEGRGLPPADLTFDGLDPRGISSLLDRGYLHELRLIVVDGEGERLESAPVLIGTSWSAAGLKEEYSRDIVRDQLFNAAQEPTPKLIGLLRKAKSNLENLPGARLLVEVHVGPSGVDENDLTSTRRAAFNIATFARKDLGLAPERVFTIGLGSTRPLRPNDSARNKAVNSRVELIILPPEDERSLSTPPLPQYPPRAFVQGREVEVSGTSFMQAVGLSDAMAFSLEARDGARRTLVKGLVKPPPKPQGVDAQGALIVPGTEKKTESAEAAPKAPAGLADDPLRHFGGAALGDALGKGALVIPGQAGPTKVTADDFEIQLPPRDSTLRSPRLFVRGRGRTGNTITVAGQPVRLDSRGAFAELVNVPSDMTALVVESRDPNGHLARLNWPMKVDASEFFLLALVDGVGGQVGARLEELSAYDKLDDGSLFVAGRGALYAKARISGTALAKDVFLTAHIDSTRTPEFSAFFDQVIDPTRDYVIYGDASDDIRDANARGRFYLMVEADKSRLGYGSFRTDIRGVHLLRYDRTFDGAHLEFDKELAEGYRTRVNGYVSDDNRRLVRRHDELRATGGSLYYLSSREIIEGSDKVELVIRELDTKLELGRTTLKRDVHYRIDYPSGRVMMSGPISSIADPFMQIGGFQPFTGRAMLDGHEVWLDIDYESRAMRAAGDIAWGVQAKQELFGALEIGGGYLREGRPAGGAGGSEDYVLWGMHAKLELSENSQIFAEYANNTDKDGATRISLDGGLDYDDLDRAPDDNRGQAFAFGLDLELGEILKIEHLDLQVKGHWRYVDAGYHAVGLASEEGTERWGGELVWRPYEAGRVQVRYDGGTTLQEDLGFQEGLRAIVRNRILARYDHDFGPAEVFAEGALGQHRDDIDGVVHDGAAAAVGTSVTLGSRGNVRLHASQEAIFGGDDAVLGTSFNDRMTTNLGLDVGLTDDIALRLSESLRWNGDNATRLGFVTTLPNGGRAYFEERIKPGDRNGRVVGSTVLGAEHALGSDGRVYTEYRLDGGVGGRTNRAVMGLGRSLELSPEVKVMLAYERSQVFDSPEVLARGSRDVVSGGLEIKRDILTFNGLYEARWDRDLPPTSEYTQILQAWARNALDLKIGDAFTLLAIFNYGLSQDLDTREIAREDLEATFGLAYRPVEGLTLISRYSRLLERRRTTSVSLLGERLDVDDSSARDLISVSAIIDLPLDLELTEKLVWRFHAIEAGLENDEDLLLWLNRLAFPIIGELELAGEVRLLASLTNLELMKTGGLVELSFTLFEHARIGLGWAIDIDAGGLLPGQEETELGQGFFLRMSGMY